MSDPLMKAVERTLNCDCMICVGCQEELEAASGLKATADYDWRPIPRTPIQVTYSKEIEERIAKVESEKAALLRSLRALQQQWQDEAEGQGELYAAGMNECIRELADLLAPFD